MLVIQSITQDLINIQELNVLAPMHFPLGAGGYLNNVGVNKWLGQPYFLEPLHEETSTREIMAIMGTMRLSLVNSCIR